jgi:hypothetical protein
VITGAGKRVNQQLQQLHLAAERRVVGQWHATPPTIFITKMNYRSAGAQFLAFFLML